MKDIYSHKVDFLLSQYQLQTLFSRCNITYFAETKHGEMNKMITDEKKGAILLLFIFIELSVIRLNSRAGKMGKSCQLVISRGCPARNYF